MKRFSTSLIIREIASQNHNEISPYTNGYYQKRQDVTSVVEEMKNFHGGNVSGAPTMQNNMEVPQKLKNLHNYNMIKQFQFWVFV